MVEVARIHSGNDNWVRIVGPFARTNWHGQGEHRSEVVRMECKEGFDELVEGEPLGQLHVVGMSALGLVSIASMDI